MIKYMANIVKGDFPSIFRRFYRVAPETMTPIQILGAVYLAQLAMAEQR